MASKTAVGRRIAKSLRQHHAAARQIQRKEPGITYLEARRRTKETFIDTIRGAGRRAANTWIRVTPLDKKGQWKRIKPETLPKGKTLEDLTLQESIKFSYGKRVKYVQVKRSIHQSQYWGLVDRTARQWGLSITAARKLLKKMQEEMTIVGRAYGKKRKYRMRDAAAVLEFTDRYQNVRQEFGI